MVFDNKNKYVICDGAMGTMLQKRGLKIGQRSDIMNMTSPEAVEDIHRMYIEAGSEIIFTNTFGANSIALRDTGYTPEDIITSAIEIAKRASRGEVPIALDIGPTGVLMEPIGDLGEERVYELFREQAIIGSKAGADLVVLETMSDINELKAAISALKAETDLPIMATMTFDKTGKTYLGCTPEEFVEVAESLGADAVGLNCSLSPIEMTDTAVRLAKATDLPLVIKPNAGLPDSVSGQYSVLPHEFSQQMMKLTEAVNNTTNLLSGAEQNEGKTRRTMLVGGCCWTSPDYIRELRKVLV